MQIRAFGIEQWMNEYETQCEWNLAETCIESLTMHELIAMSNDTETVLKNMLKVKMTYGAITGSFHLRKLIATRYERQEANNILITHGAVSANSLVYETLVEPGNRVISVFPTYQQHYSIPESHGADVKLLHLREENNFLPDLEQLKLLVNDKTNLIALNNPNNPTGALMDEKLLNAIVEIARGVDAYLLCDEVYRGTDQAGNGYTASVADLYEKGISTGSMSKTYSLAGLRLGWIAGPRELLKRLEIHRDYNTISVGILNDYFAALGLENHDKILARNHKILRENLQILDEWVTHEPSISYVRPVSGTTALLKYSHTILSRDFCIRLIKSKGVMLTPGSAMDMEGYVRIGYANDREVLKKGLGLLSTFLQELEHEAQS